MKKAFLLSFIACSVGVMFSPQIVAVAESLAVAVAAADASGGEPNDASGTHGADDPAAEEELIDDAAPPTSPSPVPALALPSSVQVAGPAPAPPKEMLAISIAGPIDGVRGDKAYFHATVTGSPDFVSWELSPPAAGLDVLGGGRAASFANRQPGVYVVRCTISGAAGHVSDTHEYEILADLDPQAVGPVQQNPAAEMAMQHQLQPSPNAITWPVGIRMLADRVASSTRSAEGKIVAGSFRSVASRIKVGTFAGVDPWDEAYRQSREALGGGYGPWGRFFADLAGLVGGLRQQGLITNPASSVLLLESAAESLGKLQ